MNSLYDAKVDTIVQRDFSYLGKLHKKDDIFKFNPSTNCAKQKHIMKVGMIAELDEDKYSYICLREYKEFLNKTYVYGDIIDMSEIEPSRRLLYVKRGWFKKVITENYLKQKEDAKSKKEDKLKVVRINVSTIAKELEMKAPELKEICNIDLKMNIRSYSQKISEENKVKIISHFKQ